MGLTSLTRYTTSKSYQISGFYPLENAEQAVGKVG